MTRDRLPARRLAETIGFDHITPTLATMPLVATLGFYEDGRIGEVFLYARKDGTDLDTSLKDSAILLSFALQHGATVEGMQGAMTRNAKGEPEGAMGRLLDLIARDVMTSAEAQ